MDQKDIELIERQTREEAYELFSRTWNKILSGQLQDYEEKSERQKSKIRPRRAERVKGGLIN